MPRLSGVRLCVSNPAEIADFYVTVLGMQATKCGAHWRVGYLGQDADLLLMPGGSEYAHARSDRYWKIGITLPNLDMAFDHLTDAGVTVSQPRQFRDIGYMCHLSDPAGFQIELLQHDFEGHRPDTAGEAPKPLGGGARLGQITVRSGDIEPTRAFFEGLGMRLLSVQRVQSPDFTLYFWAFTQDCPPNPDLEAVENREWLWKRAYTTLEVQYVSGLSPSRNVGYQGLEIDGLKNPVRDDFGDKISLYSG